MRDNSQPNEVNHHFKPTDKTQMSDEAEDDSCALESEGRLLAYKDKTKHTEKSAVSSKDTGDYKPQRCSEVLPGVTADIAFEAIKTARRNNPNSKLVADIDENRSIIKETRELPIIGKTSYTLDVEEKPTSEIHFKLREANDHFHKIEGRWRITEVKDGVKLELETDTRIKGLPIPEFIINKTAKKQIEFRVNEVKEIALKASAAAKTNLSMNK